MTRFSLRLTDVINGVPVRQLSKGEREFLESAIRINRLGYDFTYMDFRYSQSLFRQYIHKLKKLGLIIKTINSRPCFYRVVGENTGSERRDLTHEGMGVGFNMQNIINEASKKLPALHDIKLKFSSEQVYQNAIKLGITPDKNNNGIFEKDIILSRYITANIAIYPKSVSIELACTYYPIIYDIRGAQELLGHLTFIKDYLWGKYQARNIPDPLTWIATHYHLNQDGNTEFSDKAFQRTVADITGGFIRIYAKRFPDNKTRIREERIFTPNVSVNDQLNDMKKVSDYLLSSDDDISHIMPSQILSLNKFALIVSKMASLYNPSHNGWFSF